MKYLLTTLIALLFAACGSDPKPSANSSTNPDNPANTPATTTLNPNAVYLDGLYATSTEPGHDIARLFDNDPASGWRTRPGAGPDEGLMLYFSNTTAVQIQALKADAFPNATLDADSRIQIYVNGQPLRAAAPGERVDLRAEGGKDQRINSIFLRFSETANELVTQRSEPGEDLDISIEAFPAEGFVGLQSLTLFNDKGEAISIVPPKRIAGKITASSTLSPESAYGADNLFDSRKEFAWAEGNTAAAGEGETLRFHFDQPVRISGVQIWNGYQRSTEHYRANARTKDFQLSAANAPAQTFTLRDDPAGQKIDFPTAFEGQDFELKINNIYPGKKYKDLAISEILFYDGAQPFVLHSDYLVRRAQDQRSLAGPTPLAGLLDRRIYNVLDQPFDAVAKSIILRSDGTFVLYEENESYDTDANTQVVSGQTIADGNWEMLESKGGAVKVKVFGKWFDATEVQEWYKGPRSKEATRIFSDVLTITASTVEGQKMIGTFYRK
ncbi:MAG: hypothetical protein JNL02_12575 [Saprospiraceae bacterium]|nr:hypothetical protein [Saprospiraceae bacterium]